MIWALLAGCGAPQIEVVDPPHFAGCEQVLDGPVCVAGESDLVLWLPENTSADHRSVWVDGEERAVQREPAPDGVRYRVPLTAETQVVEVREGSRHRQLRIAHEGPWDAVRAQAKQALTSGEPEVLRAADDAAEAVGARSVRVGMAMRMSLGSDLDDPDTASTWLAGVRPDPLDLRSVFNHGWASCRLHVMLGEPGDAVSACQTAVLAAERWGAPMPRAEAGLLQATVWQGIGLHEVSLRAIAELSAIKIEHSRNRPCATAEVFQNIAWGLLAAREAGEGVETWTEPFDAPHGTSPGAYLAAARRFVVDHQCAVPSLAYITLTQAQQAVLAGDGVLARELLADASLDDVDERARFWGEALEATLAATHDPARALVDKTASPAWAPFAWRAHYVLAERLRRAGEFDEALVAYELGSQRFRELLPTIPYDAGRAEAASVRLRALRGQVAALLKADRAGDALSVVRRFRAEYVRSVHRLPAPEDEPRVPSADELMLSWFKLDDGWVGFASTSRATRSVRVGGPAADPLSPFDPELREAIEAGGRVTVLATGEMRAVDMHAAPFDGQPLIAHLPVQYSLDLPPTPTVDRDTSLLLIDPAGDLLRAAETRPWIEGSCCGDGAHTLQESEVQLESVRAMLDEGVDLLHFDGHAAVRRGEPYPVLELADGVLTVDEILQTSPPNLVMLLACGSSRTAATDVESLGLVQAFLTIGTPAAVGTTSVVEDAAAARFAQAFYVHRLTTPDDPAMAYTRSLREQLRDPSGEWKRFRMWIR